MKKLILFFAVLTSFAVASCGAKKECTHEGCKETCDSAKHAVKADSSKVVVDTVKVDTTK